jgi:hypothetical protein
MSDRHGETGANQKLLSNTVWTAAIADAVAPRPEPLEIKKEPQALF